jgi:hypothetical protein
MTCSLSRASRSMVSDGICTALRERTRRKNTTWRIAQNAFCRSCCRISQSYCCCAPVFEFQHVLRRDDSNEVALAALFDKETKLSPQQRKIKESVHQCKCRGLDRAMFTRYDYLILFNCSDIATVERSKEAIHQRRIQTVQEGRGMTIWLGEYGRSKC